MLLIGLVLWTVVGISLYLVWRSQTDDSGNDTASSPVTATPDSNADDSSVTETPVTTGSAATSVKLSFPTKPLEDFEFQECMGDTLSLEDLKGKPWVASFIFTRCRSTCPQITTAMMELQKRVSTQNPEVNYVSFSVDPEHDTPEMLKEYSETWQPNRQHWKFVTGRQQELYDLFIGGFAVFVKENVGADRVPGFEVAHSNRVVLVNEDAIPVGTFLGTVPEDMHRLQQILTGKKEFPEPGPRLTLSNSAGTPIPIQLNAEPVEQSDGTTQPESDPKDDSVTPSDTDAQSAVPVDAATHNAQIDAKLPGWTKPLPSLNAALNTLAAILLCAGFRSIRNGKKERHRNLMISAFVTSVVFLVSYLTYHYAMGRFADSHGRRFVGEGIYAVIYPCILWPHVALAACVPVMAIRVFQHAFAQRWEAHRRLARLTFPIWMFVSITGVIIYGMLYHWPQQQPHAYFSVS